MASGITHKITGLSTALLLGVALARLVPGGFSNQFPILLLCLSGGASGARAPDWMEVGVIGHRTVTHWWPLWLGFGVGALYLLELNDLPSLLAGSFLAGFSVAGFVHLLLDLPNPMGIPLLTPRSRVSLNLWQSGQYEWLIIPVWLTATLWPAWILAH